MIVTPLKQLEESMDLIARGSLNQIAVDSKDREIVSLVKAFNKMLMDIEIRRRYNIQSEKLASLGTLLSGVAHELNNPLANISSSCQILIEEFEEDNPEFKKALLHQIDEQTIRARDIVLSLLEFSREKAFKKDIFTLKKLIEQTLVFIRIQTSPAIDINLDVPEDIIICADKQRIQQAFINLIKNAVDAIHDKGTVSIKARKRNPDDGKKYADKAFIDIEISDTGEGISPDLLDRIFDPFFTTKDAGKGSGLGLFIVHDIIEEHRGNISVKSTIGKGTTFLIQIPEECDNKITFKDNIYGNKSKTADN
jgi:signal transduction histidine kinase